MINESIREAVETSPISNVHEHIISSAIVKNHPRGLIEFIGDAYLHDDLISAGASEHIFMGKYDLDQSWDALSPYLSAVRNTTYYRCLIDSFNDLFDLTIHEIDDSNWRELDSLLREAALKGETWYEFVLHKKAKMAHIMLDMDRTTDFEINVWGDKGQRSYKDTELEQKFFTYVARTDVLLNIVHPLARPEIERLYNLELKDLDAVDALIASFGERAKAKGAVSYKCVGAYFRTLTFEKPSRDQAARAYACVVGGVATEQEERCVQDYMMHRFLQLAAEQQMHFQYHTGMQALNANMVDHSNPLRLNNLFLQYPEVNFTMLHGGYPYTAAAGVLAKKFPNVFLDFSWLPQIGFSAARHALDEWLDLIPMNKFTWGGDCRHVENSYSTVILLKKLLMEVLSDKVSRGNLSLDVALEIVNRAMYANAIRIYGLEAH